jgi:hypothetical protein
MNRNRISETSILALTIIGIMMMLVSLTEAATFQFRPGQKWKASGATKITPHGRTRDQIGHYPG